MKRTHLALLVITAVTALFSAYSLAAINQVYKVNFEWFSQYFNVYHAEERELYRDQWALEEYPSGMRFQVIGNGSDLEDASKKCGYAIHIAEPDFSRYVYLHCTLGKVYSPEYRIKVVDIAQRGSSVEVKASLSSPAKTKEKIGPDEYAYIPEDIVRIDRYAFPVRGKINFVFKNQEGNPLYDCTYEVK